jgi:alpha/beta hydrolase family protein
MSEVTYARLRVTDPRRWRAAALRWRSWANQAGRWAAELGPHLRRLRAAWTGRAASAAAERITRLRRGIDLFRLACWAADQALSEFAAALARARVLLGRAAATARRFGLVIDDRGTVRGGTTPTAGKAARDVAGELSVALDVAAAADSAAAGRLTQLATVAGAPATSMPLASRPACSASPAEVRGWWGTLPAAQQHWLIATEPNWIGQLDGIPAASRDLANRLLLDDRRAELEKAVGQEGRLRGLSRGLDALTDRLAGSDDDQRAYLLHLDLAEEGRVVVALGDPDRADNVLTHVPGMTADLSSYGGELARAERVAVRAGELGPAAATSAVLWLNYDAPDFVDEAASGTRAEAGAVELRRFQDGLRSTHEGDPARQTVLGHSYGSLVVGKAAAGPGMAADSVVFVGSPGVGVDSAAQLHLPPDRIWSTTSRSDVIQYAAVAPGGLLKDIAATAVLPGTAVLAFGKPEDDLWYGRNPSDPAFGARTFASQPDAGHLGYWDRGRPALDALATITLGGAP